MRDFDRFNEEFDKEWRRAGRFIGVAWSVTLIFLAVVIVAAILAINKWLI